MRSLVPWASLSATQLPLVVAIVEIGVRSGQLEFGNCSHRLVGAGMVSVLLFPMAALYLRSRSAAAETAPGVDAENSVETGPQLTGEERLTRMNEIAARKFPDFRTSQVIFF